MRAVYRAVADELRPIGWRRDEWKPPWSERMEFHHWLRWRLWAEEWRDG